MRRRSLVNKPDTRSQLFFFFSSRRRHTRFDCDWSSDVCSSDLGTSSTKVSPRSSQPSPTLRFAAMGSGPADRKSTRLNSSHSQISYAVFCLKKKKTKPHNYEPPPHSTLVTSR